MKNVILSEGNIYKGAMIEEDTNDSSGLPIVRKWYVKKQNHFWSNGWDIICGQTTRIIFPYDFFFYYI